MATDIFKNKLFQAVIKNGMEIAKKDPITPEDLLDFKKGTQSRDRRRKDPYVRYNGNVSSSLFRVLETLDDLRAVQVFLKQYPYPKTLKNNKITRTGYATYHIEVYYLKVASLRDKCAILINDIFQLGLPEKRVTIELLSEMQQLKNTKCMNLLNEFSKAIGGIIKQRNLIAHREKYDDKELMEIRLYELLQDKMKIEHLVKIETRMYIQKNLKLFKKNQVTIENFVDAFFSYLASEFEVKSKALTIRPKI